LDLDTLEATGLPLDKSALASRKRVRPTATPHRLG
jgi:hypothetical protein